MVTLGNSGAAAHFALLADTRRASSSIFSLAAVPLEGGRPIRFLVVLFSEVTISMIFPAKVEISGRTGFLRRSTAFLAFLLLLMHVRQCLRRWNRWTWWGKLEVVEKIRRSSGARFLAVLSRFFFFGHFRLWFTFCEGKEKWDCVKVNGRFWPESEVKEDDNGGDFHVPRGSS